MLDQLVTRIGSDRPVDAIQFDDVDSLLRTGGGICIGDGLLRIHTAHSAQVADGFVREAFPDFDGRIQCFAFDWLGRQFSLDLPSATNSRSATILLFEPGTGEALEIPVGLDEFFHQELVHYSDAVLAESFFAAWRASGGREPAFTESVGYKRPLFLGGVDEISNLELAETPVYWGVVGQLRLRATGRPRGTRVDSVIINDT